MNSFFKKMWWLQKAFFHLRNIRMRTLIFQTNENLKVVSVHQDFSIF